MHIKLSLGFALLLVAGCGTPSTAPAPQTAASPPAATTSDSAPQPAGAMRAQLVGRWAPTLPRDQARSVAIVRWALADPPNSKALAGMRPTSDEQSKFDALLKLRATDPASPALRNVRQKLAEYDAMLVTITADRISFHTADSSTDERYDVVEDYRDGMLIIVKGEKMDVRFVDRDHVLMHGSGFSMMRLTRDDARGMNPRDLEGAAGGAVVATNENGPTANPGGKGGDACEKYADCIDEMPRLSGDQSTMHASSSSIRAWERTPERLRMCSRALEMARSASLCR